MIIPLFQSVFALPSNDFPFSFDVYNKAASPEDGFENSREKSPLKVCRVISALSVAVWHTHQGIHPSRQGEKEEGEDPDGH